MVIVIIITILGLNVECNFLDTSENDAPLPEQKVMSALVCKHLSVARCTMDVQHTASSTPNTIILCVYLTKDTQDHW